MKIVVFGANGRTGVHVVKFALRRGHTVRAFVRSSKQLKFDSQKVDVVEGNANNYHDIRAAVDSQDVIISVIGHRHRVDPGMQTRAMYHVLGASHHQAAAKRLISLSSMAVKFPGDKFSLAAKFMSLVNRIVDYTRVVDARDHAEVIRNSDIKWTILRVLKLSRGKLKKSSDYKLKEHGRPKLLVSRKTIASILIRLAEDESFIKKAPVVSRR